jgi:hypothetical protein
VTLWINLTPGGAQSPAQTAKEKTMIAISMLSAYDEYRRDSIARPHRPIPPPRIRFAAL